jgi:hypothetical protein
VARGSKRRPSTSRGPSPSAKPNAGSGSGGGATSTTRRSSGTKAAAGTSSAGARSSAPTRARSTTFKVTAAVLSGLAALGIFVGIELFLHRTTPEERALLAAAPQAIQAAGCTEVQRVAPYPGDIDRAHIGGPQVPSAPALSSYPSVPPVSGPHEPAPLAAGAYRNPPDVFAAIHALEHAAVVIWVDPAHANDPEVERIRAFFTRPDEVNHVIVAPYSYPDEGAAGRLPEGTRMALAAWHRLELCRNPSLAVAYDFVHRYRFDLYHWSSYEGEAPERFAPI